MKVVIPAAGLGTRFLPATKALPKEMLPIVDKPIIQFVVEEAVQAGLNDFLMVTGRNKNALENHFDRAIELEIRLAENGSGERLDIVFESTNLANIHYIRQKNPLGLGHAVLCSKTFIGKDPFVLMLGDEIIHKNNPILPEMIRIAEKYNSHVVALMEVPSNETPKYGMAALGEKLETDVFKLSELVEKPALGKSPSNFAIIGRYVLQDSIFKVLEQTNPGINNEIQLTDALNDGLRLDSDTEVIGVVFRGRRFDAGDKQGYLMANVEFALEHEEISEGFNDWLVAQIPNFQTTKLTSS